MSCLSLITTAVTTDSRQVSDKRYCRRYSEFIFADPTLLGPELIEDRLPPGERWGFCASQAVLQDSLLAIQHLML